MYINRSRNYTLMNEAIPGHYIILQTIGSLRTMLYTLEDENSAKLMTYCLDANKKPIRKTTYSAMNLEEYNSIIESSPERIRSILLNSYPYVSISDITSITGISRLSIEDTITATQAAIWFYTNNYSVDWNEGSNKQLIKTKELYEWYMSLSDSPANDTISHLEINAKQSNAYIDFGYKASTLSNDGSEIIPSYSFEPNVASEDGTKDSEGFFHVFAKDAPKYLRFWVNANQNVARDAYLFYPINTGIEESQPLAAVYSGNVKIAQYLEVVSGSLTINKVSNKGEPLQGAVFNIYEASSPFQNPVYENLITNENGKIEIPQILVGSYQIVEMIPPTGYIPIGTSRPVEIVRNTTSSVSFLNVPIPNGSIQIEKHDDFGKPLSGAVFNVYAGLDINGSLVYENVVSDQNGQINNLILVEGSYTILEVKPPDGYYAENDIKHVEVVSNQQTKVVFINLKKSSNISRVLAKNNLIESVALEQTALSHILNAEGEKIQKIVSLDNTNVQDIKEINKSVKDMINAVSNLELVLQSKLAFFSDCICHRTK